MAVTVQDALTVGAIVKYDSRVWRVGMVNECRARLDPVSGVNVCSPTSGRSFSSYGTSVNVAPNAWLESVDEAQLTLGERARVLSLLERQLEAEMAVAETPVGKAPAGNKNTAANEARKAKLAEIKAAKAADKTANPKVKAVKDVKPCKCGCGGQTTSFFIPGHDAKFKSALLKIERGIAKPEELLTEAVRTSYKWKKTTNGKGLIPTTNYKGEPHAGYDNGAEG